MNKMTRLQMRNAHFQLVAWTAERIKHARSVVFPFGIDLPLLLYKGPSDRDIIVDGGGELKAFCGVIEKRYRQFAECVAVLEQSDCRYHTPWAFPSGPGAVEHAAEQFMTWGAAALFASGEWTLAADAEFLPGPILPALPLVLDRIASLEIEPWDPESVLMDCPGSIELAVFDLEAKRKPDAETAPFFDDDDRLYYKELLFDFPGRRLVTAFPEKQLSFWYRNLPSLEIDFTPPGAIRHAATRRRIWSDASCVNRDGFEPALEDCGDDDEGEIGLIKRSAYTGEDLAAYADRLLLPSAVDSSR